MKKRIIYIDILRALAIILVIIGHIPYPGLNPDVKKWVYSFHIPLFFFVSGMSMTFTNYKTNNIKNNLEKRFQHIYLPYLIWAILLSLPNITLLSVPKIIYGTHKSIASVSNSSLWFLPVLFLSTILIDLILFILTKKKKTAIIKILPLIFLAISLAIPPQTTIQPILHGHNFPFGLDIVPMASTFIIIGYLFQNYKNTHRKIFSSSLLKALVLIISIFLTTFFSLQNEVNYTLMAENRYGNIIYFLIASFSGIIMSIILSISIEKHTKKIAKLLQLIGANTLIIFILQKYPLALLSEILLLITTPISNWILIPLNVLVITPICLLVSLFFKKHAPILTGYLKTKTNY